MLAVGLLTLAFLGVFWRWFLTQHRYSSEFLQDWGHAYAIPLIAGYLLFQRREQLLAARARVF